MRQPVDRGSIWYRSAVGSPCAASAGTAAHRSAIEPLVIEFATAILFALFGLEFGADVALIAFCVMGAALVALVWIDLREFRLPREITYTAMAISAVILVIAGFVNDEPERDLAGGARRRYRAGAHGC